MPCNSIEAQEAKTSDVVIELYMRSDRDQSKAAVAFLDELSHSRDGLNVKTYDITEDQQALARLWELSRKFGYEKPGVPTFYFGDSLKVGFSEEYTVPLIKNHLTIRAFVRTGCPRCREAKRFLDQMVQRWPALRIEYLDVAVDASARAEVQRVARKYGVRVASFPCIEVAGRVIVGYQSDSITGRKIEELFKDRSFQEPSSEPENEQDPLFF